MNSETESVHTADAGTSGDESADGSGKTREKRQLSMLEVMQRSEQRKGKRNAPGEYFNSPPGDAPGAKRRTVRSPPAAAVDLNPDTMKAIEKLIEGATAKLINTFSEKFEGLQKRLEIVESEIMTKDQEVTRLKDMLSKQEQIINQLQDQVEGIDSNRRLSCLILSCADFKRRQDNERWVERATEALNRRIPGLDLDPNELSTAHRLPSDGRVIIKFVRRCVRDRVLESRFELAKATQGNAPERDSDNRQLAPLFITECLTPTNRAIYDELLRARRSENGRLVTSVFSRKGVVICRKEPKGENLRVHDEEDLRKILGGKRFPPLAPNDTNRRSRRQAESRWSTGDQRVRKPTSSVSRLPNLSAQGQSKTTGASTSRASTGAPSVASATAPLAAETR